MGFARGLPSSTNYGELKHVKNDMVMMEKLSDIITLVDSIIKPQTNKPNRIRLESKPKKDS